MSDLALTPAPPRAELLRQLEGRLGELIPGARLLAHRILGAGSRIDLVALEPTGRMALVLVGEDGEDLELVGRGLAQRAWVRDRLADWIQLAPELGLRPDADVKVWLVCPSIRPEARDAVAQLGPEAFGLAVYRCVRNGSTTETLVEALGAKPAPRAAAAMPVDATEAPVFRTGLTDADLGLTADERRELDSQPPRGDTFRGQ